jgi:hypothetical protein
MYINEQVDGYLRRTEFVVPYVSNNNSNKNAVEMKITNHNLPVKI